ncbi:MAG TPA: hypothetical protein VJG67_02735, partial [Candidatus Paceibacterota bacterium]
TINQLAFKVGRSHVWVRQQLDQAASSRSSLLPQPTVIAVDVTFWGRHYGVCVFRSPTLKRNLWWREVELETPDIYALGLTDRHQIIFAYFPIEIPAINKYRDSFFLYCTHTHTNHSTKIRKTALALSSRGSDVNTSSIHRGKNFASVRPHSPT